MNQTVKVKNLTRRFGEFVAVRDVSFEVTEGEIFGYLGANGAGKSTTIRILCGLLSASSGEATVAEVDVIKKPNRVRKVIGYMSQKFSLYLDLTVIENLEFFGGAYGLFGNAFKTRCDELVSELDLVPHIDKLTADLPGGTRQKLALACAVLHKPKVLFLDEPTAGVAPEARRIFWRLIRDLADKGTTVFVTTHYLDEAEYCDRVGLMVDGRLAALDTPKGLKSAFVPGRMMEVYGASAAEVRAATEAGCAKDPRYATKTSPILDVEPFGAGLHIRVAENGPAEADLQSIFRDAGLNEAVVASTEVTLEDVFLKVVRSKAC